MTAAGTKTRAIAYQEDDLIADIDGFRQSLTSARQDGLDQARVFQRLLDTTLHAAGGGVRRLLIAADGPLGDLPFAALVDPGSRQRLVERYEIALLPGLPSGVFVNSSGTPRLVLAVGYNGAGSGLPALRYAEAEAARVGAFYPAARVEAGPAATPAALTAAAPNADVIHIAAHARANRMAPWESRLVLAPDGDADGALTFEAVERWDLRRCRAVVLSACETSTASRARGQGMLSLATPFLHAGAACVIGTLWPVDDRASALFMDLLHHRWPTARHPPPPCAPRS
jgi:CHAT domain-containing protein